MKYRVLMFVLLFSAAAAGQTAITFGGHYWYAQPSYGGEAFETIDVSAGNLIGPYFSLNAGPISLGCSFFWGTFNWDFTEYGFDIDNNRSDLNISLGFRILPRLTVFGAMKRVTITGDESFVLYDTWGIPYDADYTAESSGMLFGGGASGTLPFAGSPFFLFWSAAYLTGTMNMEEDLDLDGAPYYSSSNEGTVNLTSLHGGIGVRLPQGLMIMVGYRADLSGEGETDETIHGVMATLAYSIIR